MEITKELLIHWWHYYGKVWYTLAELNEFEKIIDEHGVEKVLEIAMASYMFDDGSPTILLLSIRNNMVDKLIESLPKFNEFEGEDKEVYIKLKENFINTISETYNN